MLDFLGQPGRDVLLITGDSYLSQTIEREQGKTKFETHLIMYLLTEGDG